MWHMAAFRKQQFPTGFSALSSPEDGLSRSLMTEHLGPAWGGPHCWAVFMCGH